jgi:hypothetical protein
MKVKKITKSSARSENEVRTKSPRYEESGKTMAKIKDVRIIRRTPPPTGVPALIS